MSFFRVACDEYRWLRDRGYPEKAALALVGDRHRLGRVERNCMFRGVAPAATAAARRARRAAPVEMRGVGVGVDWYNVLITVESFLKGVVVFECEDGWVRDSAGTHGSYRASPVTPRAVTAVAATLAAARPSRADLFLDAPLSRSAEMAATARDALTAAGVPCTVELARSADGPLARYDGLVATSDSSLVDRCARAVDLARAALESELGFTPPLLGDLFP